MNQPMRRKQLSNLLDAVSHPSDRARRCPVLKAPFLQRSSVFTGALDFDFDATPADTGSHVRLPAFVGTAVGFLSMTARQVVDVFDNSPHYGFFPWCLHDCIISEVDISVT